MPPYNKNWLNTNRYYTVREEDYTPFKDFINNFSLEDFKNIFKSREDYNKEQVELAKNDIESGFNKSLNFITSYAQSPGYKSRQSLFQEGNPLDRLKSIKLKYGTMNFYDPKDNAVYIDINSNLYNDANIEIPDLALSPSTWRYNYPEYLAAHEIGHALDMGSSDEPVFVPFASSALWLNKKYHKKLNKSSSQYSHDSKNYETYADLIAFRTALYRTGIFDSRGVQKFTKDHLDRFKQVVGEYSGVYPIDRFLKQFSDEDIIKMMNEVAYNEQNGQNLYAKRGAKLIPRKFKK